MTDLQTPATPAPMRAAIPDDDGPRGIGGWLILPILHLVANGGMIVYIFGPPILEWVQAVRATIFAEDGSGASLSNFVDTFSTLSDGVKLSLAFALFCAFLVGYIIICLTEFFRKKRSLPKLMIGFYLLLLVMVVSNYALLSYPELEATAADYNEAVKGIVRVVIGAALFIPYFLVSKRVKNTFVR